MFSKLAVVVVASFALFAAAAPAHNPTGSCSTGPVQCCNSVQDAHDARASKLLGFLGIDIDHVTGPVGLTCNPISAAGIGGNSCNSQAVCCSDNSFHGVVALGCTPINVNL